MERVKHGPRASPSLRGRARTDWHPMSDAETSPVRVGVVGAGFMGMQHVQFVRSSPETRLVAVADPVGATVGCPTYPDARAMLESEDVEAVIIANPNALHVDTAIECLEAGVAVLLEKPIAVNYLQSLRL